jgi:hypothetical protein
MEIYGFGEQSYILTFLAISAHTTSKECANIEVAPTFKEGALSDGIPLAEIERAGSAARLYLVGCLNGVYKRRANGSLPTDRKNQQVIWYARRHYLSIEYVNRPTTSW